jgi:hypothetical protein
MPVTWLRCPDWAFRTKEAQCCTGYANDCGCCGSVLPATMKPHTEIDDFLLACNHGVNECIADIGLHPLLWADPVWRTGEPHCTARLSPFLEVDSLIIPMAVWPAMSRRSQPPTVAGRACGGRRWRRKSTSTVAHCDSLPPAVRFQELAARRYVEDGTRREFDDHAILHTHGHPPRQAVSDAAYLAILGSGNGFDVVLERGRQVWRQRYEQ